MLRIAQRVLFPSIAIVALLVPSIASADPLARPARPAHAGQVERQHGREGDGDRDGDRAGDRARERDRAERARREREGRERKERERVEQQRREREAREARVRKEHDRRCATAARAGAPAWQLGQMGCYVR